MVVYRSIGEEELMFLINTDNPVYGNCRGYTGCGIQNFPYGVVSFFKENIRWKDSFHLFHITVNIPDNALSCISTYWASKDFGKTKVWTGREGKTEYKIEECFTRCYWPTDIIGLEVCDSCYTDTAIKNNIVPFCRKYNIKLTKNGKEI